MDSFINLEQLKIQAKDISIELDDTMLSKFDLYAKLLVEWNNKINLTAITQPDEIVTKHFVDSLTLAEYLPHQAFSLIDVGTGAGFPGIPLALFRNDMRLLLLDSLNKRITFLSDVCKQLDIPVELKHARAEDAGKVPELREKFDCATARAVASLTVLSEYCLPFVKVGGVFIAMKGPDGENEANLAGKAIKLLGGKVEGIHKIHLQYQNETMERQLVIIRKISPISSRFPRNSAKIAKTPLK